MLLVEGTESLILGFSGLSDERMAGVLMIICRKRCNSVHTSSLHVLGTHISGCVLSYHVYGETKLLQAY